MSFKIPPFECPCCEQTIIIDVLRPVGDEHVVDRALILKDERTVDAVRFRDKFYTDPRSRKEILRSEQRLLTENIELKRRKWYQKWY